MFSILLCKLILWATSNMADLEFRRKGRGLIKEKNGGGGLIEKRNHISIIVFFRQI